MYNSLNEFVFLIANHLKTPIMNITKNLCLAIFSCFLFISCQTEELPAEIIAPIQDDVTPVADPAEGGYAEVTTPCDFTADSLVAGANAINCVLDLKGATINLPADISLDYQGGAIVNGTLNFTSGVIDGDLLNASLSITGNVQLKSTTFNFVSARWGIVEGSVSDAVAENNKWILRNLFEEVKSLGANTFQIDELDAYFLVSKESNFLPKSRRGDIFIPSDFNLIMTDNTHLRVQPNNFNFYVLLSVLDASNVTIKGGNLHGDRDEHNYDSCGGPNWCQDSSLLTINAGVNVTVDGVNIYNSTADGIIVASLGFTFDPEYKPSHNVRIKNCVIDKSRRNNISLVNGYDIIVENCQILNAGVATDFSVGTNPKAGIDVEALRDIDENGNYIYYEIAKDIIIRNNVERGSERSAIIVAIGDDTLIENNDTENGISFSLATGIKIRNNRITGLTEEKMSKNAIGGGVPNTETTFNNEISGNVIKGYGTGITLYNRDVEVFNNTIENAFTGIFIPDEVSNTNIYENTIKSNFADSRGIASHIASLDNVNINNNVIDVLGYPVSFINVNLEVGQENHQVLVSENTFISPKEPQISNSIGIVLSNNN